MKFLCALVLVLSLGVGMAGPAGAGPNIVIAPPGSVRTADTSNYTLDATDKVRVLVFNEPQLSGEFTVNSHGTLALPLIGEVPAAGLTTQTLQQKIEEKLSPTYIKKPSVSIDVLTYRSFYVLGEVNKPSDYPYVNGLTVVKAVAMAEGFTYRADKRHVYVRGVGETIETRYDLGASIMVRPGDILRIGERYF